jgi:hypothetical protein
MLQLFEQLRMGCTCKASMMRAASLSMYNRHNRSNCIKKLGKKLDTKGNHGFPLAGLAAPSNGRANLFEMCYRKIL